MEGVNLVHLLRFPNPNDEISEQELAILADLQKIIADYQQIERQRRLEIAQRLRRGARVPGPQRALRLKPNG